MLSLFADEPQPRDLSLPDAAIAAAGRPRRAGGVRDVFESTVDARMLEVYDRAADPADPFELRDLWLGRVEHQLGQHGGRPWLAEKWTSSTVRRSTTAQEVLSSRATVRFVKELFNWYFRDDLYGELRPTAKHILSGGAVDEEAWGLPAALKQCVSFALGRDWYGYSDSRGRWPARAAVAEYENNRINGAKYAPENVALTMGGTLAVSALSDFILHGRPAGGSPALCAVPNYPPLVEAVARRGEVRLVPLPSANGVTSLEPLIAALRPDTPMVMMQTAGNPTGALVREEELSRLITAAGPNTTILLDECHEWLGPVTPASPERAAAKVVRVSSLSKNWSAPGLKVGWMLADERFVAEYYEYASTSFGGPPSFFYTLVEVLARMERWVITDVVELDAAHLAEFESTYGVTLGGLQAAYSSYRQERMARDRGLTLLRDATTARFSELPALVLPPRFSVNMAVDFPEWDDSYLCFRDMLRETGVSMLPGILTFCMSGAVMRVTSAQKWANLEAAMTGIGERVAR
ncbi:Aspartate aminotransferase [Alloactinosynnema sp. L-07]|uniref:pyridoxal phosphate-dependent aminotransferase n=1 Tax=Alloactinosynnema sp. L-07 TaxID=1653480 RepID=UPI00065EF3E8|nr:aminotransferase class I/II-fold pyridoxal phosphate-dependent enzyme [Alloactinosynnema sp. L-07]CRK61876.1 Aspartate aminotransferase [Alloactinosynnema sp. L-07]